ncbi:MAG: hypothetical protein ACE5J9_03205, partial [Methanosarcinales archaeon]
KKSENKKIKKEEEEEKEKDESIEDEEIEEEIEEEESSDSLDGDDLLSDIKKIEEEIVKDVNPILDEVEDVDVHELAHELEDLVKELRGG